MSTVIPNSDQVTALVTGANRGLGRRFATELVARGAKVYAAARRPETIDIPGVVPVALDITDPDAVRRAAEVAADVNILVNNAGVSTQSDLLSGDIADIRLEMETHYFGTLGVTRAFAPIIEANGGGAILNVLSVLSWVHAGKFGAYSAAKAAGWAMTDALREQLAVSTWPRCTSASWTPTWRSSFLPTRRPIPRWSPRRRSTGCSRVSRKSSPTS
jgi:NAD(P)-dependent dehydrogenase (short-subunit alcohol dehydrogenase family)